MRLTVRSIILGAVVLIVVVWLITLSQLTASPRESQEEVPEDAKLPLVCDKIGLVYTWVNGSDPEHIRARIERSGSSAYAHPGNNRFRDLGGLMYSLRSIEKFAPWIHGIYIVTTGQVPGWLDTSHPSIHIVPHSEIFPNKTDLPTFSSNAIEASFHNLPDEVGDCFIYLNDDMFLGNKIEPSDFWDLENGQKLYKSSWTAPPPSSRLGNTWHRSIGYTNTLLDKLWGRGTRNYASHGPYFFSLKVLRHVYDVLAPEFHITTTHPFRHENDVSIPFLYNQWADHYYKTIMEPVTINSYVKLIDDPKKMQYSFDQILQRKPKTVCLNDALGNEPSDEVLRVMHTFFHKMFPLKSSFELYEDPYM